MTIQPFGQTFKSLREARGLSLKEAAGDVVSPQFLGRFERGEKSISLDNFSRLLIVVGLSWIDFSNAYANNGGDCLELPFHEFEKHVKSEEDIIKYLNDYEKLFDTYLKDNPMQSSILLNAVKLRQYPVIQKTEQTVAKIQPFIEYFKKQEVFNRPELELYMRILNHCPLELIRHMAKHLMEQYKKSADTDTYIVILNSLSMTVKHYSELGFYLEADTIIQDIKAAQTYQRGYLAVPLMILEVENVYNLLRWNKPEAIPTAKNLFNYFESAKFIDRDYYTIMLNAFTYHCNKFNKTGIDLF